MVIKTGESGAFSCWKIAAGVRLQGKRTEMLIHQCHSSKPNILSMMNRTPLSVSGKPAEWRQYEIMGNKYGSAFPANCNAGARWGCWRGHASRVPSSILFAPNLRLCTEHLQVLTERSGLSVTIKPLGCNSCAMGIHWVSLPITNRSHLTSSLAVPARMGSSPSAVSCIIPAQRSGCSGASFRSSPLLERSAPARLTPSAASASASAPAQLRDKPH